MAKRQGERSSFLETKKSKKIGAACFERCRTTSASFAVACINMHKPLVVLVFEHVVSNSTL